MPIANLQSVPRGVAPDEDLDGPEGAILCVRPVGGSEGGSPVVETLTSMDGVDKGARFRWDGHMALDPDVANVVSECVVSGGGLKGKVRWTDAQGDLTVVGYGRVLPVRGGRKRSGPNRFKACEIRFVSGEGTVPSARADAAWAATVAAVPLPGLAVMGLTGGETFEHDPKGRRSREEFLRAAIARFDGYEEIAPYWQVPLIGKALFFEGLALPPGEMAACGALARRCGTRTPAEGYVPFLVHVGKDERSGAVGVDDLMAVGTDAPIPVTTLLAARASAPRPALGEAGRPRPAADRTASVPPPKGADGPARTKPTGRGAIPARPMRPPPRRTASSEFRGAGTGPKPS